MPPIRIRLFGSFALTVDDQPITLRLQSARKLLSLLALRPGQPLQRAELARLLWPDEDYSISGNRLRTALVEVRAALQPYTPVEGDAKTLEFLSADVESDAGLVKDLLRKLRVAVEKHEEEQTLLRLREALREDLLPEFEDDWFQAERQACRTRQVETLLRLSEIASEKKEFVKASEFAGDALKTEPFHERGWRLLLRALAKAGKASEATLRFREAKRKLTDELSGKFSRELIDLARAVRDGEIAAEQEIRSLTSEESELVGRTFATMLETQTDEAFGFLASSAFREQSGNFPTAALQLLSSALDAPSLSDETRIKLTLNTLHIHYLRSDSDETLKYGEWLLQNDPDPLRRAATLHMLALIHYKAQEIEQAYRYIDEAEKVFIEHDIEHRILTARAQRLSFDMFLGHLDEAISAYIELLEKLRKNPQSGASALTAIPINIGVGYMYKEDFANADYWLTEARTVLTAHDYRPLEGKLNAAQGYVKAMLGFVGEGTAMTLDALVRSLRQKEALNFASGLEQTAHWLAVTGSPERALALIEKATEYREEDHYLRSKVEQAFVGRVRKLAGNAKPDPEWLKLQSRREVLAALVEALGRD